MSLKRFFVDNVQEYTELSGEEFEHAKNVLRIGVGAEVILLDNSGKEYTAIVTQVEKKKMLLHVVREELGNREPSTEVCLLFGYLKNADKNEFIVQKAVELGVSKIGVFSSDFSSAYMNENKLERLNKIAREATKQCLRSVAPTVTYFSTLKGALDFGANLENKLFACEFSDKSERELATLRGSTTIVVGSEGGFSENEAKYAKEQGYQMLTLGKRILRAETACVALTAVVMHALGEWQ